MVTLELCFLTQVRPSMQLRPLVMVPSALMVPLALCFLAQVRPSQRMASLELHIQGQARDRRADVDADIDADVGRVGLGGVVALGGLEQAPHGTACR